MASLRTISGQYTGYRTPYHDEVCSERLFLDSLKPSTAFLLPIGRQMKVFGVEKLDLLAIDRWAHPWVFEFKRDVAPYEAVAQLLTYGSYVARWSRKELEDNYSLTDKRRNLRRAFRARFGQELPDHLTNQVNLVLAAFDFSLPCRQAIQFLQDSVGLVVGKLKIDCVWDQREDTHVAYQWLQMPSPTKELRVDIEKSDSARYFMLADQWNETPHSTKIIPIEWDDCIFNGFLPIPESWNAPKNPIPPGSGIFAYFAGLPHRKAEDLSCGLVGYGITRDVAFDLGKQLDGFRFSPKSYARLNAVKGEHWVVPIDWIQKRERGTCVELTAPVVPPMGLEEVFEPKHIQSHKDQLGVVAYDLPFEVPLDPAVPPVEDADGVDLLGALEMFGEEGTKHLIELVTSSPAPKKSRG